MIDITKKKINLYSTIGSRASFGIAISEIEKDIENLMVLTCDVSTSAGLDRFRKSCEEKYIDLGISEQNLISVASGMASEGFQVITTTFAPFQTLRCCEQIKVNLGYMKNKVIMVGLASGLSLGSLGYTHCCLEDVAVLRGIPNLTILSPADSLETVKALVASLSHSESVYIRLTGSVPNEKVYEDDYNFEIGKAISLKDGDDISIFCTGPTVSNALKASEILKQKNINASVINFHTIKPIDKKIIMEEVKKKKYIFTIEEHNVFGGLGSAVSEIICKSKNQIVLTTIGTNDKYSKSGNYKNLLKNYKLDIDSVVDKVTEVYKR